MKEIFITILLFIIIGFLGVFNLQTTKDKLLLEKEAQGVFNTLSILNLQTSKNACFKINDSSYQIFEKDTKNTLKNIPINNKISLTSTTNKICCTDSLSCTPSSVKLSLGKYLCKIAISIRGQVTKKCS